MRAAVLKAPGNLTVQEVEDASCPEGGALVRVEACAICPSDIKMFRIGHRDLSYPRILGHEVVGRVVETDAPEVPTEGARVQVWPGLVCGTCRSCRSGNDNMCQQQGIFGFNRDGGFAQYMAIPPESALVGLNAVPAGVSAEAASLTEPLACCVHAQDMCRVSEGETVLIIGAGPMGMLHAMLALSYGARAIVVEPMEARRKLVERFGAEVLEPSEGLTDEVAGLTSGRGADVAILATPAAYISDVMRAMASRGRVCVFSGLPKGEGLPDARPESSALSRNRHGGHVWLHQSIEPSGPRSDIIGSGGRFQTDHHGDVPGQSGRGVPPHREARGPQMRHKKNFR